MKGITRGKLEAGYDLCSNEGRSLEYTIQFLMDTVNVDHHCVLNFLKDYHTFKPKTHNKAIESDRATLGAPAKGASLVTNRSPWTVGK